jgi:acid phosphatase (class A)
MRKLILALSLSVLCGIGGHSFAQTLHYLGGQKLHLLKLLPPPPPPNSEADKRDLSEVLEVQENRTPERVERGLADNVLSMYRFDNVLGPKFKAESLPVADAFFKRVQDDARMYLIMSKEFWSRERPANVSKEVKALGGTPRLPTAYPSGTTLFGCGLHCARQHGAGEAIRAVRAQSRLLSESCRHRATLSA